MDPIIRNPAYLAQILMGANPQQLATLLQQGQPEIQQAVQSEMQRRQQGTLQPGDMVPPPPGGQPFSPSPMAGVGQAMGGGALSQLGGLGPQPPQMMPPGSPPMGPGATAAPQPGTGMLASMGGGTELAGDALSLRKPPPGEPGVVPRPVSVMPKRKGMFGKQPGGMLSESDRLNWQQVAAHGGQVPPAIRALLGA